ncbi:MAG: L-seryl-tRNA(Sec) selenium transferase [Thermomicrobiales bacterium]|nr:L-seryl-tRNA(Sec) selenium transferase [Thermomicrobiales bacterium]
MTELARGSREDAAGERESDNPYREIPPVDVLCATARAGGVSLADPLLTDLVRREVAAVRIALDGGALLSRAAIVARIVTAALALERPRLTPVLNATGVIIHTNLGRAPVSPATAQAMAAVAASAAPLEIEAETNARGGRMREITALLQILTGAEAALVVNNCAAAVLLVLSAVANGRDVIVSRGEAIEIGGGFRIPDVLGQSGARLVDVGTTNRTYARDYAAATTSDTAAYLKVHPSNFRLAGFTHSPAASELSALARERNVLLLEDLGSGALLDTGRFGLALEPTLRQVVASGVDLAMASGDKLLGGPQAGIIIGRAELVGVVERHPLARAVRADKVTLSGVAATLRHYLRGEAERHIPVWRMIATDAEAVRQRAEAMAGVLVSRGVAAVDVVDTLATVGGGSLPGETLPSSAVRLKPAPGDTVDALARRLRVGGVAAPGAFGRIDAGQVLLDLRTVLPEDDAALTEAIAAAGR